jgi:uncharacterized membrane protein
MFDLQLIKSKYRNVRFDLYGIFFLLTGFIIFYYGIVKFYGFNNYLLIFADLFGRSQGGIVRTYKTEQDKTSALYFIIVGIIIIGFGIFGFYIQKKIKK